MKLFYLVSLFCFHLVLNGQQLGGSRWLLISIDDLESGVSKDVGSKTKATLVFDTDSTYKGEFCSTYSGRYKCDKDGHIRTTTPSRQKKICMGLDKYEAELMTLLPMSHKYRIDKDNLFLFASVNKRLTFKKDTR